MKGPILDHSVYNVLRQIVHLEELKLPVLREKLISKHVDPTEFNLQPRQYVSVAKGGNLHTFFSVA